MTQQAQSIEAEFEIYVNKLLEDEENKGLIMKKLSNMMNKAAISQTLIHTRGDQSAAARILGINRGTLRAKMKIMGLIKK